MTRKEKLLERIRSNPKNVTFEDLDKLLEYAGFIRRVQRSGSSHHVYTKPGSLVLLTVPRRNPLKEAYVKQALELIAEYGDLED